MGITYLLVEPKEIDLMTVRNSKTTLSGGFYYLVEPRGIEPLSEGNLEGLSPGAVCYLHSLSRPGTNTLPELVAS